MRRGVIVGVLCHVGVAGVSALAGCEHASGPNSRQIAPVSIPMLTIEEALDVGAHIREETFLRNPRSACMFAPLVDQSGRPMGPGLKYVAMVLPDRSLLRISASAGSNHGAGVDVLRNWERGKALRVQWYLPDTLLYSRYQDGPGGAVGVVERVPPARAAEQLRHLRSLVAALSCPRSLFRDLELPEFLADSRRTHDGPAWLIDWQMEKKIRR